MVISGVKTFVVEQYLYLPYSGLFSRLTLESRTFIASESLFTVGLWSNEPLSSKIKSAKCLSWSNPRKFSASKITRNTVVVDIIFVVATCTAGKGGHSLFPSWVKLFMLRYSTTKITKFNVCPPPLKITRYNKEISKRKGRTS